MTRRYIGHRRNGPMAKATAADANMVNVTQRSNSPRASALWMALTGLTSTADGAFNMSKALKAVVTVSAACLWVVMAHRAMADHKLSSGGEPDARQIDRGRYLVKISGCNDCHTAGYAAAGGNIPESQWLLGDTLGWHGPWGTTYPINLRLFMNSVTQDQWVKFSESFQSNPPMPWWLLHDMNRQDRKALYAYVRWLGPAGQPAPSFVPPEQDPVGAVVQFPAPPKK